MAAELQPLIDKVWRHCEDKGSRGRTVTLKMKFNGFEIITRSKSVPVVVASRGDLEKLSIALLRNEMPVTSRCGSWGFLFLHCKTATKGNRNLASRSDGGGARVAVFPAPVGPAVAQKTRRARLVGATPLSASAGNPNAALAT
jgi:hypothetical protein